MPNKLFSKVGYSVGQKEQAEMTGDPVTVSDSIDLPSGACKAIYVTTAGNVNINLAGGGTAVLTSLTAGQIVVVAATRILSTSTTATGIYALYTSSTSGLM